MKNNKLIKCIISSLTTSLFLLSVIFVTSCARIPSPSYIDYIYDKTEHPFSFEYPTNWEIEVMSPDSPWKGVWIYFGNGTVSNSTERQGTHVFLASISPAYNDYFYSNAHELIQRQLENGSRVSEFHLLGEGEIKLGDKIGEWVSYSKYESYVVSLALPTERRHITCLHVAVDYKGRIYWLRQEVNTDVDSYEEFKPGFDHILETFKFLN